MFAASLRAWRLRSIEDGRAHARPRRTRDNPLTHLTHALDKQTGGHPRGRRGQDGAHHALHHGDGDRVRPGWVSSGRIHVCVWGWL